MTRNQRQEALSRAYVQAIAGQAGMGHTPRANDYGIDLSIHEIARRGAKGWQIQLTVAMGNAVDNDHLLMQPYQLLELMPLLVPVPVPVPLDVPLDVPAPVPPLLVCAFKLAAASRMVEVNTNTLRFMV